MSDEKRTVLQENVSNDRLREVFDFYNSLPLLVGKEVTFTVAPGRCSDIQSIKKRIMKLVARRIQFSTDIVAFILTRENHSSGWPHIHGVVWYPKHSDNSLTLLGGRVYSQGEQVNGRTRGGGYIFNELGKVWIDSLRKEPYRQQVQKDGKVSEQEWKDWLEYICKDQGIPWANKNCVGYGQNSIEYYIYKTQTQLID